MSWKRRNRGFLAAACAAAVVLMTVTGCGAGNAAGGDMGQELAAQACARLAYEDAFDTAANGKMVRLEGYLRLPDKMFFSTGAAEVDFFERPGQRAGRSIRTTVTMGDCRNCMAELGETYALEDLKVTTDDGQAVTENERVALSGKLTVTLSNTAPRRAEPTLVVLKVEKLEAATPDYAAMGAVRIDARNVADSMLCDSLSMAEGRLSIPEFLFVKHDLSLLMAIGGSELRVSFPFGTGPNEIEELPDDYMAADFKIHDHAGDLIDLRRPVRVWGHRTAPADGFAGTLYVERLEQ